MVDATIISNFAKKEQ